MKILPIPEHLKRPAVILLAVGIILAIGLPLIDKSFENHIQPSVISFRGVGLAMLILTIYTAYSCLKTHHTGTAKLTIYFIMYNILIIAMKYVVAPLTLETSDSESRVRNLGMRTIFQNLLVAFLTALVVFFIYYTVFAIVRHINIRRSEVMKATPGGLKTSIGLIIVSIFLFSIIFGGLSGFAFLAILLFETNVSYLGTVFTSVYSYAIVVLIISATVMAYLTFREAAKVTDRTKDSKVFTNTASLGLMLLIVYHIIWIAYFTTLETIWPFKIVESLFGSIF